MSDPARSFKKEIQTTKYDVPPEVENQVTITSLRTFSYSACSEKGQPIKRLPGRPLQITGR